MESRQKVSSGCMLRCDRYTGKGSVQAAGTDVVGMQAKVQFSRQYKYTVKKLSDKLNFAWVLDSKMQFICRD